GLWFNASEIYALLTMQQLLKGVQPGLLDAHIAPLQARLRELMGKSPHSAAAIERRVKLIHMGTRRVEAAHFEQIAKAVLDRKRLRIAYLNRDRQEVTEREVSPLQLVYYRENWLLDAWCHTREAIRSFSLDAIQRAATVDSPAIEVAQATMSKHFEGGYGIFAGPAKHRAKLKFTKSRAQYVALERWHPQQSSKYLRDGSYVLEVPYSNDQELLMDLLRHGTEVEVLGPPALRRKLANTLQEAAAKYLSPAV
ncbi:MAG: WYL domain-containing protein, partial [Comamonadaceae bacterium]